KVRFHVIREFPEAFSHERIKAIEAASGYKLPAHWRSAAIAIRDSVTGFFRRTWTRIKSAWSTAWNLISFRNVAGVFVFFMVMTAFGGVSVVAASIAAKLKAFSELKSLGSFISWTADLLKSMCDIFA